MQTNEFMIDLAKCLAEAGKAESTSASYIRNLYQLNGKKPFKNLTFLKKTDEIVERINTYAVSTQKTLYATICSVLSTKCSDVKSFKKVYDYYYGKMMEMSKDAREVASKNEKTEKQKENWIEWSEVEKIHNDLQEEIAKFGKILTPANYEKLLQYVILSLYTDIAPRRNQDYLQMYIVKKYSDAMPNDKNYLDMSSHRFIFNVYKTARKSGQQTKDIPENLWSSIMKYLEYHPLYKGLAKRKNEPVKFLVFHDGSPMTVVNAITRILNKVFGKKIGSSMLRHLYLSSKYGALLEEQKKDAMDMGHSVSQARDYIKSDKSETGSVASAKSLKT